MKRRTVLKTVGAGAALSSVPTASVGAAPDSESLEDFLEEFSNDFFAQLRESEDVQGSVVGCANEFCEAFKDIPREGLNTVIESSETVDHGLRRAKFGVQILTETGLTDAVSGSMITTGARLSNKATRYTPLIGSFNNCRQAACAVDEDEPETIKKFLFAVFAFGFEVGLWSYGAPYQMAWKGTRFVSNRTFLRLARNGCNRCVALVMSELHWAIRGSIYNADEFVTENKAQFVITELSDLQSWADKKNIDVEIPTDEATVRSYVEDQTNNIDSVGGGGFPMREPEGPIERWISDFGNMFHFDLPSLSDFLP